MDGTGLFPAATPPAAWGAAENVAWAAEMPNWSNATPVLVGDRLFTQAEPATLLCLDLSGKILWQRSHAYEDLLTTEEKAALDAERVKMAPLDQKESELWRAMNGLQRDQRQAEKELKDKPGDADLTAKVEKCKADIEALKPQLNAVREQKKLLPLAEQYRLPPTHGANGYSSNTPVSDGTHVWAAFGTGVVACYALDGTPVWARLVEKPNHGWGHSCSPVLVGDTLIMQYLRTFGLDAKTGAERWQTRIGHAWGTPQPTRVGNLDVVVTDSGDILNAADGKPLGSTKMRLEYGSYLVLGDTIYGATKPNAAAFKMRQDEAGALQVTTLWQTPLLAKPPNDDRYYAAPLVYQGLMYVVNQQSSLAVFDTATGEKRYEESLKLGGTTYVAPTLIGKGIVTGSDSGKAVVFAPGATYQETSRHALEPFRGCPVAVGNRLYIRTCNGGKSKLYCFAEAGK
ncbi:MAG: outer membrane biogenesis protein BamB [bacterium ADurb.Bin429]|nr:MAG: outer membrane biogenesis protein BamB [bacterium ADurb.Bin429]